jgi:flagellar biosynthetic protein FliQ
MTVALALDWLRQLMWVAIQTGGPVIAAGLIVGIVVAVFQAATQINDSALAFVPKALATGAALIVSGPWILAQLIEFTTNIFRAMATVGK